MRKTARAESGRTRREGGGKETTGLIVFVLYEVVLLNKSATTKELL
jgi:hypothetical protein